ncbi:MAG: PepSY domain-containing protein [Pseudomonadota bacterium]|nr:MAG: hypothetical protein DIU62_04410 [Pseudomonadota bacterium]
MLPVLAVLLLAAPAQALEPRREPREPRFEPGSPAMGVREPTRATAEKSPDRIIRDIEKKYGARVVRQQMKERNGRQVLVLRLDDGRRVWKVEVDPVTGREL